MNIQTLVERSKRSFEVDPDKLACVNDPDKLVVVRGGPKHILEPIWEKPVDDFEGPLYQEYINENPSYNSILLRQTVASKLLKVANSLPEHLALVLRAGHRPLGVQHKLLQALMSKFLLENPGASIDKALEYARTYVSDPALQLPPHCCGAATDVDLIDLNTGKLVDFGCPVNTDSEVSFLHSPAVNKVQRLNRTLLLEAMLSQGFAPCFTEWWHYSYGDVTWAYFYNKPNILYGIIEPNL